MLRPVSPAFQRACAFLQFALSEGPRRKSELDAIARQLRVNPALFGLARKRLKINSHMPMRPEVWWYLPEKPPWKAS